MGDFRRYPYLYHGQLLGFPNGRGGFMIMEFWGHGGGGGVFMTGNPKSWGNSTGGISGVESVQ